MEISNQPIPPQQVFTDGPERKSRLGLVIILLLLLIVFAAAFSFYYMTTTVTNMQNASVVQTATPTNQVQQTAPQQDTIDIEAELNAITSLDNSSDLDAIGNEFK